MLLRSGWAKIVAADDGELGFVDPMCGSGSLAIEAALIAGDVAPGLLRNDFGFLRWRGHDEAVWQRLLTEAAERRAAARSDRVVLRAYDRDSAAVRATLDNAVRAGFAKHLHAERRELADLPAAPAARGLLAVNPPYGERLGEAEALKSVYALLGAKLARELRRLAGRRADRQSAARPASSGSRPSALIRCSTARSNAACCGSTSSRSISSRNACRGRCRHSTPPPRVNGRARPCSRTGSRKNLESLGAWARKADIACYRVYDADMPEYAFSIDIYAASTSPDALRFAYVQEYAPPATIEPEKARSRRAEAFSVIPEVLDVPRERAYLRTRRKQKGGAQYTKLAERGEFTVVGEGGLELLVNFTDYLDTGLVPRPSADAGAHSRARRRQELPEFVRLHRHGVGIRGRRRRAHDDDRRPVEHLSRLGAPQPRPQRLRRCVSPSLAARGRARVARAAAARALRLDLPRSADGVALEADGQGARPATRSRGADSLDAAAPAIPADCWCSPTTSASSGSTRQGLADLEVVDVTPATIPKDFARNPRIHQCFEIRVPQGAARSATARALAEVTRCATQRRRRAPLFLSRPLLAVRAGTGRKSTTRSRRARTSAARAASARTRRAASAACRARTRRGTRTAEPAFSDLSDTSPVQTMTMMTIGTWNASPNANTMPSVKLKNALMSVMTLTPAGAVGREELKRHRQHEEECKRDADVEQAGARRDERQRHAPLRRRQPSVEQLPEVIEQQRHRREQRHPERSLAAASGTATRLPC